MILVSSIGYVVVTQLVECNVANVDVAGPSPVYCTERKFMKGLDSNAETLIRFSQLDTPILRGTHPRCEQ